MTARETAEALGVVERTVRRWIASGQLPAQKVGGAFVIDPDEAREVFGRSRAGRVVARSSELAELRGRYAEVCERLERAEARAARFEAILYPPLSHER